MTDTVTDWLQVVVQAVAAIATIIALVYAIRSGKESAQINKEAMRISRQTFDESVENRKDDVMPVLNMGIINYTASDQNSSFTLRNVGQGPIFGLRVVKPSGDVTVQGGEGEAGYYISINKESMKVQRNKSIVYEYSDLYARKFKVSQPYAVEDNGQITIGAEFQAPKKLDG